MILEVALTIDAGLTAVYAAFLSLASAGLVSAANWLRNRKPTADRKQTLEMISIKVDSINNNVDKLQSQMDAQMQMQLNQNGDKIFLFNERGECFKSNRELQLIFGMSHEQIKDFGWLNAVDSQGDRESLKRSIDFSAKDKIALSKEFVAVSQSPQRAKASVVMYWEPIHDDKGNFMWFFGKVKLKT